MAGLHLVGKLISSTEGGKENEDLPVVLASNTHRIPDRSEFLLGREIENPALAIALTIRDLFQGGCRIIGMPCNTAHAPEILTPALRLVGELDCSITFINMIDCVMEELRDSPPASVGVLSTEGTFQSGIYQQGLDSTGSRGVFPDSSTREKVHDAIYDREHGLKSKQGKVSNQAIRVLNDALERLVSAGAEAVILGCSEISMTYELLSFQRVRLIDPVKLLAAELVRVYQLSLADCCSGGFECLE